MSFTTTERDGLRTVFKQHGFLRLDGSRYFFTSNRKTNSINTFFKYLKFPESMTDALGLKDIRRDFKDESFDFLSFDEVVAEWSLENQVEGFVFNKVEGIEGTYDNESDEPEDATSYIRSLIPTVNITKGAKDALVLLDPHKENRPAIDINPEVYLNLMETDQMTLIKSDKVMKVMTTFDPYVLKSLFVKKTKSGSLNTWHVNYYVPPRWRFVDAMPAYTGFIKTLIDHLFPIASEREYVLDWLHYAIVHRNDTVLCLIGSRGTGKGILLKDILGPLIGEDYREIVNQEILTDKFNGAFKNKRYIFFDEVNVSGDRELNKFKAFCNTTIALEEKGQDSETIDNYTSLGLSSNDKKDFRAEPQERRFSVPEVSETPLLEIVTEQEVEDFCKRVSDPESVELAEFGNFLINRKPRNSSRKPLKGKYFFNLCKLSMPEWKTYIIEYLIHEGEIGVPVIPSQLTKKFKKIHGDQAYFATKRGTIETFLGDYFHDGSCRVGRVEDAWDDQRGRDTFGIIPDEGFLRQFGAKYKDELSDDALDSL